MSDVYAAGAVGGEPYIDWRAVIGGAVLAAGVSFTLLAFGSGIGLSVASTAPTWRDSSPWLWLLSGFFLVFVALCAFGFGGYAAGRMRLATRAPAGGESEFRDAMHGLFMWGLALLISALLAAVAGLTATRAAAPSGGTAGPAASVAGENILASELDELFRSYRYTPGPNMEYQRAEASRILLKTDSRAGVSADDKAYLTKIVALRTGINDAEADDRVNRILAESKSELHKARVAAVMEAFLIAAALLVGAAVAWFSAAEGGRDRELGRLPVWDWSMRPRRL
ncbi:MAG TPA: hypothetical protein VHY79_02535 [Rhizomicrobium sp.]|jgi:hypothetical protein|nr:hypothetical protein [Rhizomicrobium sp.]